MAFYKDVSSFGELHFFKTEGREYTRAKKFKRSVWVGRFREWVGTGFIGLGQKEGSLGPSDFYLIGRNPAAFPLSDGSYGAALVSRGTAEEAESALSKRQPHRAWIQHLQAQLLV